ncbi:MAG TPA: FAD-dependent oxidoreductase, partial [Negativicutes bacterium]
PVLGGKLVDAASQSEGDAACVWGEQVNISALYLGGNIHASSSILGSLITRTLNNPLIQVYTGSKLVDFKGEVGRYQATIADTQKGERKRTLNVGAVVLAAGFSMLEAINKGEYGHGLYKNVVTSLEFEHLLSASRYSSDCIHRPSDGKCAKKIAFIQCVGSREMASNGDYCSAICCMFTAKEAILAKEFAPDTEVTVFYLDIRACGKNFDGFLNRAKELGTTYLRSMISEVKEDPIEETLFIKHVVDAKVTQSQFDLVVLATGIRPASRLQETAALLKLPLNEFGFVQVDPLDPVSTARGGVFTVGGSQGPLDVPETMALASAAAAATSRALGKPDPRPARKPAREKAVDGQAPNVGVFLCRGGLKAMGADLNVVMAAVKAIPGVSLVECEQGLCMPDKLNQLQEKVSKTGINRVVVAPCIVQNNLNQFQEAVQNAGLNRMLVTVANVPLKNWKDEPALATSTAIDSTRRAIADVKSYKPLQWHAEPVVPHALIVGGGITGMTTALALADRGFTSTIVEKEAKLGGYVKAMNGSLESENLVQTLEDIEKRVLKNELIKIFTESQITAFSGHQGHFVTTLA